MYWFIVNDISEWCGTRWKGFGPFQFDTVYKKTLVSIYIYRRLEVPFTTGYHGAYNKIQHTK